MATEPRNQPFNAYLQEAASIVANDLEAFDVAELMPIHTVAPTDSIGLITVDRSDLATDDQELDAVHVGPSGDVGVIDDDDGAEIQYQCGLVRFPKSRVKRPLDERRQVIPGLHDKATQKQTRLLAAHLYRRAAGVYTAANFPARTAALASVGPAVNLTSALCDPIQQYSLLMEQAEDGAGAPPDRLIINKPAARLIGRLPLILNRLRTTVDSHQLGLPAVQAILEDHLQVEVVISQARMGANYVWTDAIGAFIYYGNSPRRKPAGESDVQGEPFIFPGRGTPVRKNVRGYLPVEHSTATMVMENFRDIEGSISGTAPLNWGIMVERETQFTDLLSGVASIDVPIVDPLSGFIITGQM